MKKRSAQQKASGSCHDTVRVKHVTHPPGSISFPLTWAPLTERQNLKFLVNLGKRNLIFFWSDYFVETM